MSSIHQLETFISLAPFHFEVWTNDSVAVGCPGPVLELDDGGQR